MSEAQHDEGHESVIKTPKQLIWTVIAAFVVPVVVIILMANFVATGSKPMAGTDAFSPEMVAKRIEPIGRIELASAGGGAAAAKTGEQVYNGQCAACHATGAANAPKLGDTAAWAPRVKTGLDALLASALKGKNAMPPQGGGALSDLEVARGVVFMANKGGASFEEPKAPAAAASAAK